MPTAFAVPPVRESVRLETVELHPKPAKERFYQMDGIRGIAMLFVFLGHFSTVWRQLAPPSGTAAAFLNLVDADATFGSSLFMMLSGFFAYGSLRRGAAFPTFFRGRLLRLYPLYLVMVGVYVAASLLIPSMSKLPPNPVDAGIFVLRSVILLPGILPAKLLIDVSWTLGYILLFYFIEAAVTKLFRWWGISRASRVFLLLGAALLWAWSGPAFGLWEARTCIFWTGMALLEVVEAMSARAHAEWAESLVLPAALVTVIGVWLRTELMLHRPPTGPLPLMWWVALVTSVTLCAFVWTVRFGPAWWKNALASPRLRLLGAASYSFYLTHGFTLKAFRFGIIPWLGEAAKSPAVFWTSQLLGLAMSVFVARAAFLLVENPLSNYALRLHAQPPQERRGSATPA